MTRIAFIGLGHMGGPMALNLVKAGFELEVYDLNPALAEPLLAAGATLAASAAAAVTDAHVVISMLPASPHVERLYLGDAAAGGLIAAIAPGALVIDCSTISPQSAQKVAVAARKQGLRMLDAPVSGGTAGAAAGTLTFMVGGEADDLELARPILSAMGRNLFHAGGQGAGQVAKICNNMVLGVQMLAISEALALGVRQGLDAAVLSDIIGKSSGRGWVTEVYNPWPGVMDNVPAARGYAGGFGSDLMLKDLGLAVEAAIAARASVPMGGLARELFAQWSSSGHGALDFSSIVGLFAPPEA
ncbi:3-hydroxyisobutyrate dehydrogenase [Crenobacter caeni]|uniref:3-hydroxyisobutyrate dehydrogenase n=1 Tax=Crenobacter caeni TaxID=2705474 RepID=A0A6B2KV00_9NEIS|nr:3-hydroxyisobutyrate dehydrogenase [Crenobacter caeni]NDV13777.1 3-hydroxyisobutyrate dehydrogenase [Crenobacter caeni]